MCLEWIEVLYLSSHFSCKCCVLYRILFGVFRIFFWTIEGQYIRGDFHSIQELNINTVLSVFISSIGCFHFLQFFFSSSLSSIIIGCRYLFLKLIIVNHIGHSLHIIKWNKFPKLVHLSQNVLLFLFSIVVFFSFMSMVVLYHSNVLKSQQMGTNVSNNNVSVDAKCL